MPNSFFTQILRPTTAVAFMGLVFHHSQAQTIIPIDPEWPPVLEEPFAFSGPDTANLAFAPGSPVKITWRGGTSNQRVHIKFSDNDGHNFSYLLASGIPATQRQAIVQVPNIETAFGRFLLRLTATGDSTRTDVSSNPVVLSSSLICQPNFMFSQDAFISNVRIVNTSGTALLANPSTFFSSSGYVNYTGNLTAPNLTRSTSTTIPQFTIETTVAGPSAGSPKNVAIWVDYNNDNQFASTGPEFLGTFSATTGTLFRRTFSIPSSVTTGLKRLRVRLVNNTVYSIAGSAACSVSFPGISPTSTTTQGETEDYAINVVSATIAGRLATSESGETERIPAQSEVYPNPVDDNRSPFVVLRGLKDQSLVLQVLDVQGRVLQESQVTPETDEEAVSLPKTGKGMYLIRVSSGLGSQVHRLVVK